MSGKVVTLGELMLRLSPPHHYRLQQTPLFDVTYGGSEANVAASLAQYGHRVQFVTRLPRNAVGSTALMSLRRFGIRTDYVLRGGLRLGIYFLEHGASQRSSMVVYDRAHSAFSTMTSDLLDWEQVMQGVEWFHFSGITPALGEGPQAVVESACRAARRAGVRVSVDLNYRAKLWSMEQARHVMRPLMRFVDCCIANEEDSWCSLGMRAEGADVEGGQLNAAGYAVLAQRLKREFDFRTVAITLRESQSASDNAWSALMVDDKDCQRPYRSRRYEIRIVDRVGAGDAFAGGLIAGLLRFRNTREALEFATAASCLAHTVEGDFNIVTRAEVDKLAEGAGTGRVVR